MRRGMLWALGATALLSLVSILSARAPGVVAAISPQMQEHQNALDQVVQPETNASNESGSPLPLRIAHLDIASAKREIFSPVLPPTSPPPIQTPMAPSMVAPAPPPPPAPAANARFLGKMVTPDGKLLVYLALGGEPIAIIPGQKLESGYVVESISTDAVTLLYPPLEQRVKLEIPPPPGP